LQGKETELQQLRQSLRERDRLIEKINSAVLESEEKNKVSQGKGTIKSYLVLLTKDTPSILLQVYYSKYTITSKAKRDHNKYHTMVSIETNQMKNENVFFFHDQKKLNSQLTISKINIFRTR